ncbi:MAG: hypothetical protein ACPGJV_09785 [Bacteriovoracaceae bacterium]
MRSLIRTCFLLIIILSAISCDHRKRIVILESGVNVTEKLKPFLCNNGHRSFLKGQAWNKDETGHGTTILEVLSQKLDPNKHCILVYKTTDRKARAYEYAMALIELQRVDFEVLLLALEDVGYFYKEIGWLDSISSRSKVVVAAGNGGVELGNKKSCNVYPACLIHKIDNQKNFFVIGSNDRRFNYGEIIKEKRNPNHKDQSGTSISAARFASELMAQD